jgi:hypothetical protein
MSRPEARIIEDDAAASWATIYSTMLRSSATKRGSFSTSAYMGKEELKKGMPRWSLRFPIFDAQGNVALIGVVSPDYQQNAAPPHFR